jgi:DNA-binding transcriptional regulator LsrR (DeoR family)
VNKSEKNLKQYTNRIAWMYWKQKISQKDIAKKFNINTVQVHRILNDAESRGSVKVFVEGSFDICRQYEESIKSKYNLKYIEVVPTESTYSSSTETTADTLDPDPLSIAYAGANTILNKINSEKCRNFGWSTGSTNARIAHILPEIKEPVSFVDTTGSLRSDLSFNPLLGLNTLSRKTKGRCYHLGAPYIFPSLKEKNKFFNLKFVKDILKKEEECEYIILGIGSMQGGTSLYNRVKNHPYLVDKKIFNQIKKDGALSESSGNFFDIKGKHFVYDEIVSKDFRLIKKKKTIAIAGGIQKASAIRSTLLNGCLFGLITDEEAAKHILND